MPAEAGVVMAAAARGVQGASFARRWTNPVCEPKRGNYGNFYGNSAQFPCPAVSSCVPWCHYMSSVERRCGLDVVF